MVCKILVIRDQKIMENAINEIAANKEVDGERGGQI